MEGKKCIWIWNMRVNDDIIFLMVTKRLPCLGYFGWLHVEVYSVLCVRV